MRTISLVFILLLPLLFPTHVTNAAPVSPVMVSAAVANPDKALLLTGDYAFAFSMRDPNNPTITPQSTKFQMAVNHLEALSTSPAILHKVLVLSSIDDLTSVSSSIPTDVDWVGYNTEGQITPQYELNNPASYVPAYASQVHAGSREMMYVPLHTIFDSHQKDGSLGAILQPVDAVIYQAQQYVTTQPPQNLCNAMNGKYGYVKGNAPSTLFGLQLWIGTNGATTSQIITDLNLCYPHFDFAVIGTISDTNGTATVLNGLSWR